MTAQAATQTRRQGGPLVTLLAILVVWIAMRVVLCDVPALTGGASPAAFSQGEPAPPSSRWVQAVTAGRAGPARIPAVEPAPPNGGAGEAPGTGAPAWPAYRLGPASPVAAPQQPVPFVEQEPRPAVRPVPVDVAIGHHIMWMAALSKVPLPWEIAAMRTSPQPPFLAAPRPEGKPKRWSADAWLLLRRDGSGALATGAVPATYGASQAGGVFRYKLNPGGAHQPTAYVRATVALNGVEEREAAVGISARPIPSVPIVAAAELRASDFPDGTHARPAAFVVTQLPRFDLPHGMRGEFYAQAGYVGGTFSTAFADGQLRVDRRVADLGDTKFRAGAGAWAGTQKGARRIDLGPGATIGFDTGAGSAARVAVDWRFRVAGNARPASGPALTLSAGF